MGLNLFSILFLSSLPVIFWFFFYFKKRFISWQLILSTSLKGLVLFLIVYFLEAKLISHFLPGLWTYLLKAQAVPFFEIPLSLPLLIFFIIAPLEEILKFFVLKKAIFKSKEINQIIDGIQVGIILGLAFATGENFLKFSQVLALPEYSSFIFVFLRFFISTLAHLIYSGVMGYYLSLARFHKLYQRFLLERAVLLPIFLHGMFNFFLVTGTAYLSVLMLAALSFVFYKWYNDRKLFEIRLAKREIPLVPPLFSEKPETDVYLSMEKVPFDFIKKIGLFPFGYRKPKRKTSKRCLSYHH